MEWFEYLIMIAAISFVFLVVFFHFYLKKKGKSLTSDCGGNCAHCAGNCHSCSGKCGCNNLLEEYRKTVK